MARFWASSTYASASRFLVSASWYASAFFTASSAWASATAAWAVASPAVTGFCVAKTESVDEIANVAAALDVNAAIEGKRILFSFIDPSDFSQIGFYTLHDTRPGFLAGLGLPVPTIVEDESAKTDAFYTTVSAEEADRFSDVDIFVTYGDPDGDLVDRMQADPLLAKIPAIAAGHVVILPDSTPLAASARSDPPPHCC